MEKRTVLVIAILTLAVLLSHFLVNETASVSASIATIRFDPQEINIIATQPFEISVKVTNVINSVNKAYLKRFTLRLSFNNTLLSVLGVRDGAQDPSNVDYFRPFNQTGTETTFNQTDWNATGAIRVAGGYKNAVNDQTLAIVTFSCKNIGQCYITLNTNTNLVNSDDGPIDYTKEPIPACKCTQSNVVKDPLYVNGNLTLTCNLFLSGEYLFIINASNVVLDLNGFAISALGYDQHGTAIQAFSPDGVSILNNICIKNGTMNAFQQGISAQMCNDLKINNVRVWNSLKIGVFIQRSSNITIFNSTIDGTCSGEGIWVMGCCKESGSWVNITDNKILNNINVGISLEDSYNCSISRNTIQSNQKGLLLNSVQDTTVFNNNFIGNGLAGEKRNAEGVGTNKNSKWYIDYPYGGNYWDDYDAQMINDSVCGKNGTIPECDGIGDQPYQIRGDTGKDKYPLLCPFNASELRIFETPLNRKPWNKTKTTSLIVAIFGDFVDVGNLTAAEGGLITFDIDGGSFCDVIVQSGLLSVSRVYVDNGTAQSTLYWDGTYTFAYFKHDGQSRQVKIVARMTGDVNADGTVDITDIAEVARQFGWTLPNP